MNQIVSNVRATTLDASRIPMPFDLITPGTGMLDATLDGGRKRVACPRREWFVTGFVVGLALFAVLALFVPSAKAATIAESVNDSGGKLVLTDQPSRHCAKDALLAYTSGQRGEGAIFGCWTLDDPDKPRTVFIMWLDDREVYTYPAGIFDVIDDEPATEKLRL